MRTCQLCGEVISDKQPFAVCQTCFLAEMATPADAASKGEAPEFASGLDALFPRRDFFKKYDIVERVGTGGQGEIWKVWDYELRRHVAMKRLSVEGRRSAPALYRFLAEAQITSQLEHPGILPIFDVGLDPDDRPYFTTSLLPGTTLEEVWKGVHGPGKGSWSLRQALDYLSRVCDILSFAHSRGVIHRDLKPRNILVGAFREVRVVDWGAAYIVAERRPEFEHAFVAMDRETVQTARGEAIWANPASPLATEVAGQPVTVAYSPPEILEGRRDELGPTTDVYAVGVMLYELLAGRLPYSNADGVPPEASVLRDQIKAGPPASVQSVNDKVRQDLAAICEKAMAHSRLNRYQNIADVSADLRAWLEVRPVAARQPGVLLKTQRCLQRNARYAALVAVILVTISVSFATVKGIQAKSRAEHQLRALGRAELARRSGHWREVLEDLDNAEAAGFNDPVSLGLQRAEAWTVLNQPVRAGATLQRLLHSPDLGSRLGEVLLNTGDHELFDKATVAQGEAHVRAALKANLSPAEKLVANGLIAETVPTALTCFQQALQLDPYSYSAHIHSLGLEFVLGRHSELTDHIRIFSLLYPDDPSPRYVAAVEAALSGDGAKARAALEPLRPIIKPGAWDQLARGYEQIAEATSCFKIDGFLRGEPFDSAKLSAMSAAGALIAGSMPDSSDAPSQLREPHLPCLEHGLLDGVTIVQLIGTPYVADVQELVNKIKDCWKLCPEGVLPFRGALLLEGRQPKSGPKSIPLLAMEASLYQMAADSESFIQDLPRTARYLAARTESELVSAGGTDTAQMANNALRNIRAAAASGDTLPGECRAYFEMSMAFLDYDSAKMLLDRWEKIAPDDPEPRHDRIELYIKQGNFGAAVKLIDSAPSNDADGPWIARQRTAVIEELRGLIDSIQTKGEKRVANRTN